MPGIMVISEKNSTWLAAWRMLGVGSRYLCLASDQLSRFKGQIPTCGVFEYVSPKIEYV
jgi:hypothetical protein